MSKRQQVVIIDDERLARVELKNLLLDFPKLEVVAEAGNADAGLQIIRQWNPDLIFLDVQMPEKSGFDLLEEIEEVPPVIFTTAHDEYAIKAFEFNALDYLLKPVQKERLREAIERINKKKAIQTPSDTPSPLPYPEQLFLKDGDRTFFVALAEISLFSSYGNYVKVHFGEQSVLVHRSLNQMESRLPPQVFFRANRYSILNVKHIVAVQQVAKSKLLVHLSSGHEVTFSERRSIEFRSRWGV